MRYAVQAHPRAARERVELLANGSLAVWVRAPAVDGRANEALVAALAAGLGLRPREVVLVRGDRSRHKVVDLPLDTATVRRRLGSAGDPPC